MAEVAIAPPGPDVPPATRGAGPHPGPPPEPAAGPVVVPARVLSRWVWALSGLGLLALVVLAKDLAGLVVFGAVLAYLLAPAVNALERRGVARTRATALVLGLVLAVAAALVALALPVVSAQLGSLHDRWVSGELLGIVAEFEASLATQFGFVDPGELGLVAAARDAMDSGTGSLIGYVPSLLSGVGNSVVVPFVLFALLRDGSTLRRRMLTVVPNRYFEFAMTVLFKADAHLGGYLRGQALIALLVGSSTALGLGLLGVDYYLVLGLFTGLANFVPYVGFVVSAGLSLAVSVLTTGGTDQIAAIVLLYLVLQSIENIVFQPWITGRNVSMHPVLVLLAILIGGRVAGVPGMALAVPTAAILKVVFLETVIGLRRYHL